MYNCCDLLLEQEFKRELYQHRVELESIGHQNLDKPGDSQLSDFRERWDRLEEEAVNRQVRTAHYSHMSHISRTVAPPPC